MLLSRKVIRLRLILLKRSSRPTLMLEGGHKWWKNGRIPNRGLIVHVKGQTEAARVSAYSCWTGAGADKMEERWQSVVAGRQWRAGKDGKCHF